MYQGMVEQGGCQVKYKPECDSCKDFITTDKTPKALKRKNYFSSQYFLSETKGHCKYGYCRKHAKGGR